MISVTDIRNKLIDQLMAIKDVGYLKALSDMIDLSHVQETVVPLTEEQKIMLTMSEEDIKTGRTIDQYTLNERELEWLKRK
jgi:pantothenate kinase